MIYVWYYCTERANKMRLVSTKDKLVLFCSADEMLETLSLYGECFLSLWFFFLSSLSRKLRMKLSRLLSCVRIQAMTFQGRVQLRERESEKQREKRERTRKAGSVRRHFPISNKRNSTQPPPKTSSAAVRRAYQQWFCFVPACVCVCVCECVKI